MERVSSMQAQEIERYLVQLGQELVNMQVRQRVRILLIGGAFMLLQMQSRRTTDDIDVFLKDIEDTTVSPLYQQLSTAVRTIATRNHLRGNWFSDIMGESLRENGQVPVGTLWRTFGMLDVYLPPKDYILALKLMAGRQKDREDITALSKHLKIRTRQQAQMLVDRYIPNRQWQQLNDLDATLDDFFA